jgi:NAD+ kinase
VDVLGRDAPGRAHRKDVAMPDLSRIGLVVHPTRRIDRVFADLSEWASADGASVGQVRIHGKAREVAEAVRPEDCDLLVALGGDGTALAALHAAAPVDRPVLGVACGSVGALTSATADRLAWALEQLSGGRWSPRPVPALELAWDDGARRAAINDVVVARNGPGQLIVSIVVGGEPYASVAGDGVVVATELGSSAYSMAAGGPLLVPATGATVVTPLATHGGACPPLVADEDVRIELIVEPSYGGLRYEVDGQRTGIEALRLAVTRRAEYATLVTLAEEESWLSGLRRRGLVLDSPRVLVRGRRDED